jgi:hypothetical protein
MAEKNRKIYDYVAGKNIDLKSQQASLLPVTMGKISYPYQARRNGF